MRMEGVKFFIQTPNGESVEIKGGVDWADVSPGEMVEPGFDFSREISVPCTFEEPQNIKELKEAGFTDRQAWNIHFCKGENWKEN
ncbi:PadR family transcriptional regulator [Bacillus cereus]|uniref:PadR family transcriptional regulator n=1 Tax=Bacillus cereus TaxID=1396 RepID=UPI000BEB6315|nr:PadR family transcriptional regulator [Bacillus cereus]PDZ03911.1 PadR family transcriptional regulator [Bacillus cereus]PFN12764.1 PadR family transcriptional regulator [Bacillus cereus]PFO76631.1 PadR family transcriptional regulator [Bacillus cereus]PFS62546.1 PadR family transcriptional regulator [Bacillus cereus]PFS85414.1 PadR family transcriptional regulator [Bacillus cereus]